MDEYEYIDAVTFLDDERNARGGRSDHRAPRPGAMTPTAGERRTPRARLVRPAGSRPVVIYQQPPQDVAPPRSGLLANLTSDEIVELAAQVLAAIQPLPAAPTGTGDVRIDIENLITYQGALALHAKRDEQLRTVGSLLSKLMSK